MSGTAPAEMVNSWNCPGAIWVPLSAVQVMRTGASVMVPSSVLTGFASVSVSTEADHPGIGW